MTNSPPPDGEKLPVENPAFWKGRLLNVVARGEDLHKAVHNIDYEIWSINNQSTRRVLSTVMPEGARLLDAGCGLGTVVSLLPPGTRYTGVDISPDFIDLARVKHPGYKFLVTDMTRLPFADGEFDYALARSIMDMVVRNLGESRWLEMERELLRVADKLIVIEYDDINKYKVLNTWRN